MDKSILVSIVTVCFNSAATIRQTIESVLNQTYKNIEYIIIDGKSTDETVQIAEQYLQAFDGRMQIISEPDKGIYDAMNKGIRMSSGELIGIINSDDFYEPDAVEKMVLHYQAGMCAVLYGATRNLIDEKEESISIQSPEFLEKRMIGHPSCFITKSAYEKYGLYDLQYCSVADYDLMLRYKRTGKVSFIPVYDVIANFRSGGMCSTHKAYLDLLKLQKNYGFITKYQYRVAKFKADMAHFMHK